jgi:hypothetical protein
MMYAALFCESSQLQPKVATMTAEGENDANPIEMFAPVDFLPALSQPALYTVRRGDRENYVHLRCCWVTSLAILQQALS